MELKFNVTEFPVLSHRETKAIYAYDKSKQNWYDKNEKIICHSVSKGGELLNDEIELLKSELKPEFVRFDPSLKDKN